MGMDGTPKPRVAVIFGGRSAEHEISVVSARSVLRALDPKRHDVLLVGIDKEGRWHRLDALPTGGPAGVLPAVERDDGDVVALSREPGDAALVGRDGNRREIDVVFPVLHGPYGEDGSIQGMLEVAGIPYVGAGVLASAVGMDKAVQKVLFSAAGLRVVPHQVVLEHEWDSEGDAVTARVAFLGLPVFVKPATLGSSVGISKVKALDQLPDALAEAFSYGRKVVVEQSVEGAREIECGVLGNDEPVASVPGEIVPAGEFYDYRAKYLEEGTRLEVPADLLPVLSEDVRRTAVAAFRAIDAAGMARVDFFVREPADIIVNEINTIPGFTEVSMFPKMWEAAGISYSELLDRLVRLALERHRNERKRGRALGAL